MNVVLIQDEKQVLKEQIALAGLCKTFKDLNQTALTHKGLGPFLYICINPLELLVSDLS